MKLSIRKKLFLSHFLAIILVSGSIGSYFYQSAIDSLMNSLQSRLKYSAALLSHSFLVHELDQLSSAKDAEKAIYQSLVLQMQQWAFSNPDIAFIYVMRKEGDKVYFVVDSDKENPATPGEQYTELLSSLLMGFEKPSVDEAIATDKWGSFMSGYAPVAGSNGKYLVGIDMRADEVARKLSELKTTGYVSLVFSLALALLFSHLLSRNLVQRINVLHQRCARVGDAEGVLVITRGDEIDELSSTFTVMLDRLEESHAELEKRVEQRTQELTESNTKLQAEILERERIAVLLEQTARTDYLTKLLNRRAMVDSLQQEVARVRRTGQSFSVVLIDVDHFKHINDTYGHDVGDEVLKRLSSMLNEAIREQDVVARWGGEEILLLLPNTTQAEALEQAERIRDKLHHYRLSGGGQVLAVTASFGVSEYRSGSSLEQVLKQADVAMYEAKMQGRDRVVGAV